MKKQFLALSVFALVALLPTLARADLDPCVSIVNVSDATAQVCFDVTNNGDGTFTLTTTSVTASFPLKSINSLAWNTSATFLSTTFSGTWSTQTHQHIAGFEPNLWANQVNGTHNVTNGGLTSWTFNGDPGTDIVFHLQGSTGCSLWVSDRPNPQDGSAGSDCGSQVPEPATLTLLGIGLVGLGTKLRRRRK